jgi:hypothetical protein
MEAEFHHLSIASKETLAQAALGGATYSYMPMQTQLGTYLGCKQHSLRNAQYKFDYLTNDW